MDPDADIATIDIKLPTSFLGSKQWASEQTADSLALVRKFGCPTFLITMTCNGEWPEITSQLRPGQSPYDVPVIVARTFKQRFRRLLTLIRERLGLIMYLIYVIEFQKRGYPHGHVIAKER